MVNNYLPESEWWKVCIDYKGDYAVFSHNVIRLSHEAATARCARAALFDNDPAALMAVLMCTEDVMLHWQLENLKNATGE